MLPAKSTPGACTISLTGMTARSASPAATIDLDVDLIRDTEPRKKIGLKPNAAGASGNGDAFGLEQELFECLDGAQVRSRGPRSYRHAEGHARKIHVRFGGDSLRSDQLTKSLPREDYHIGRHATGELRSNRLRPSSLRGTRPGRDFDAACSLEFRQQFLVCATKSAGY